MRATALRIRIGLFLVAVALAALNWGASPVSSQPQSEGGLQPYAIPASASSALPLSPTSPGHVDFQYMARLPSGGWPGRIVPDKIVFTGDIAGGLGVGISGAEVHDRWTWEYYYPGNPPPGGVPDLTCWMAILEPWEDGNNTPYIALVTNCGSLQVLETFPGGCPCTPHPWAMLALIAGYPAQSEVGTWTAIVDYTDPGGVTTPAVAQDNMYLMYTPAVVLIHGWDSNCEKLADLEHNIEQELAVTGDRVTCYGYHTAKGVAPPATDLAQFVRGFRQSLGMGPDEEVDLVGHSMGGLVARYYYQFEHSVADGPIGSISMLGTPNEGVFATAVHQRICHAPLKLGWVPCHIIDWGSARLLHVDLSSDSVRDMDPGSDLLTRLNEGFSPPEPPQLPDYRAHAGLHSTLLGRMASGSGRNDCFVSVDSVDGPGSGPRAVFGGERLTTYDPLTHGGGASVPGCDPPTLTDDVSVVQNLVVTIKGNPAGGAGAAVPAAPALAAGPGGEVALLTTVADLVLPSESKTHVINVPAGLGQTGFVVYWLDDEVEPSLGVTLRRPDGTAVSPSDPDVAGELTVTGDGFLDVLMRGYVMSAPQAGDWQVTVQGVSVPDEGQAYLVALMPDSQVVLSASTKEPALPQGQPEVIKATLFHGATAIAVTSISARVATPAGTEGDVVLRDDGTSGDEVAGDLTYSGTFTSTTACGGYSVLVTATGDSSEGTVTRQQFGFFQAQVPGDAVRDPCNPDDDEDLLTDADEFDVYLTDPLDTDTDDDGCADSEEIPPGTGSSTPGANGGFNPNASYDFYDVPIPANNDPAPNGTRNQAVNLQDVVGVLKYVGTADNGPSNGKVDYDSDKNQDGREDGVDYDRSPSPAPNPPKDAGPPNGAVNLQDVVVVLNQVGLDCSGPPPAGGEGGLDGASGGSDSGSSGTDGATLSSAPNAMAVDAIPGGSINQWRWWLGGSPFDIDIVVTAAGEPYAAYDLALSYDDQILEFVPTADRDGDTVLESWGYTGLGGMGLKATVSRSDLDGDTVLEKLVGGSALSSGTTTATGAVVTGRFRCVGNGVSPLHLVTPAEAVLSTTTIDDDAAAIDTSLADANVWCWGIQ
jgi:hypothetical protein